MAPQINFLTMAAPVKDSATFAQALELLKAHGVIKGYSDIVKDSPFKYPNISNWKNGTGFAPKGFIAYFNKQYGAKLKELKDKPIPEFTASNKPVKEKATPERISKKDSEIERLEQRIKDLEEMLADKRVIIEMLSKRN